MHPKNRLRELRKAAGLSQVQLAEATGVSQSAISQIENDVLAMDMAWMRSFARVLDCTAADLLPDEDNPDRLTDDERELINRFREATGEQQAMIFRVAEPLQTFRRDDEPARKAG